MKATPERLIRCDTLVLLPMSGVLWQCEGERGIVMVLKWSAGTTNLKEISTCDVLMKHEIKKIAIVYCLHNTQWSLENVAQFKEAQPIH